MSQQKNVLDIYDNAVAQTHTIRQVHPMLLTNLKFPSDLTLSSVGLLEGFVCEQRKQFMCGIRKAVVPLKAYAKAYDVHLELYNTDVVAFVR